ncbi:uncharacterized mitochondrial protein AtMg00860-like [Arachis stenosperma]|uniref:uncharacterized mitochondrial protein AtMg00860-like n=1 Tax=Arachis stenosperma TaxID=217475 RepID=UPI0025ACF138|nr:uncharacterized mitochondrial protein AtMg00860-like [Arachis stenosperma]
MVKQGSVLGHVVSNTGISVDQANVNVISSLHYPSSVREVRSFLGHAGFYQRFIKDFSKVALPLSRLLQKDVEFELSEDCMVAFDKLKIALTQAPIVRGPDWSQPFEILCDASNHAVGAALAQHAVSEVAPWYAPVANYLVSHTFPPNFTKHERDKLKSDSKYYIWDDPYLWRYGAD